MMMNIAMAKIFGGYYFDTIPDDLYDEIKIIYAPQIVLKGINDGIRHFSPASIDNDALVQCWPRSTSTMCLLQVWMETSGSPLPALTLGTSGSICADCQAHPRRCSSSKDKRSCPCHRRGTLSRPSTPSITSQHIPPPTNQHNNPTPPPTNTTIQHYQRT